MGEGRVLWFDSYKGYGCISHNDGREVFFHYTSIADSKSKRTIDGGILVHFDLFETNMGWEASNVRLIGAA